MKTQRNPKTKNANRQNFDKKRCGSWGELHCSNISLAKHEKQLGIAPKSDMVIELGLPRAE
jgi:hypothetical protein